jgi:hypothetical protein
MIKKDKIFGVRVPLISELNPITPGVRIHDNFSVKLNV